MIERKNYFHVKAYLEYQEKVLQLSSKTIRRKWAHLRHLLEWADSTEFTEAFKIENSFPQYLLTARNDGQAERLSPISLQRACGEARSFFRWAKMNLESKYKQVPEGWIESLRPARKYGLQSELEAREYYKLEEVRKLVNFQPVRLVDKRDRAAIAMLFVSGMRASAFVSLPIRCVDLKDMAVNQLPSEGVQTKNSKAARTYLLPIYDLLQVVQEWDNLVRAELGKDGLWYPNLTSDGMDWKFGETGSTESRRMAITRGLKRFCEREKIEYRSPHKLRNGHGVFGVKHAKTIEEFKAFSQNMMHESMNITDSLYSRLATDDIKEAIFGMEETKGKIENNEMYNKFTEFMRWLDTQK